MGGCLGLFGLRSTPPSHSNLWSMPFSGKVVQVCTAAKTNETHQQHMNKVSIVHLWSTSRLKFFLAWQYLVKQKAHKGQECKICIQNKIL